MRVENDAGASAKNLDRAALQRALSSLARREADALLVAKLDRLTRSVRDLGTLIESHFAEGRSGLISVGESVDTRSAAGRLVLRLLTSVAEWEREAIGERTSAALKHLRAQGRKTGGDVPFGYSLAHDGSTLVDIKREQATITRARAMREAGMSLRAIGATLAHEGRLSRVGKPLHANQIARMIAA